jgi:ubiquitin-activating enzyme E1 C
MKSPGLTATVDGKSRTLYMPTVASIEEKTRVNLKKSLNELGLEDGSQLMVADSTSPNTLIIILKFPTPLDCDME